MSASVSAYRREPSSAQFYLGQTSTASLFTAAALALVATRMRTPTQVITLAWFGLSLALWGAWLRHHWHLWSTPAASVPLVSWLTDCHRVILIGGLLAAMFVSAALATAFVAVTIAPVYWFGTLGAAFGVWGTVRRMTSLHRRRLLSHRRIYYGW